MTVHSEHQAIVIGGSMSGLLAARVLADHFERVTLVERDRFPDGPGPRKGVPQARHLHALLIRGRQIMDQLFPGLEAELMTAGALLPDIARDFVLLGPTGWAPRFESGLATYLCSRDLLEWCVRRRVAALPQVCLMQECEVLEPLTDAGAGRITGVRAQARHPSEGAIELPADLIVDASGRNSKTQQWLTTLGYPAPQETIVNSFLGYATRCYARPKHRSFDWKGLFLQSQPPAVPRGGGLFPIEGDRWLVTLAGAARDYPPTDEAGFMEFARSLRTSILYDAIHDAEPLSPIYGYQRTENRLLHYEDLPRWPEGFVALGDAVCAFNPIYGQGMTTGALGALLLGECLRAQRGDEAGLSRRFQRALAKSNSAVWLMATGEDFRYPTTIGDGRGPLTRWLHDYILRVQALAADRPDVFKTFIKVLHLTAPPAALFQPSIAGPILWRTLTRHRPAVQLPPPPAYR